MNASDTSPRSSRDEASDLELVQRIIGGEKELYALLIRKYNQRIFRTTRALLKTDHEAEDVVQQAYVRAYSSLSLFRGESSFATWITRICINEARMRARKTSKHPHVALVEGRATTDMKDEADTPEEAASRQELGALLEGHIESLPENLRIVFVLREVEELTTDETSDVLQISPEAVRVRLHRARKLLEERLSNVMAEAPRAYRFDGERCDRMVANVRARLGI
jgi:RNA polymerase sigma-70 factor (ECF subfamily)